MSGTDEISLTLTAEGVDAYCRDLGKQAPGPAHALAAMVALQSLVTTAVAPSQRFTPGYDAILSVIGRHAEEARMRLLEESSQSLLFAMREKNLKELTRQFAALSRNGFREALRRAALRLAPEELASAGKWAGAWLHDATSRALAASGYPDALNFKQAGIDAIEHGAMQELDSGLADAVLSSLQKRTGNEKCTFDRQ